MPRNFSELRVGSSVRNRSACLRVDAGSFCQAQASPLESAGNSQGDDSHKQHDQMLYDFLPDRNKSAHNDHGKGVSISPLPEVCGIFSEPTAKRGDHNIYEYADVFSRTAGSSDSGGEAELSQVPTDNSSCKQADDAEFSKYRSIYFSNITCYGQQAKKYISPK